MKLYITLCYEAEVQNLITVKAEECYQDCQSKVKTTAMSNKLYEIHRDNLSSIHLCPQNNSGSVSELLAPVAWGDSHIAHMRQEQWLLTHSHQAKTLHMDELQMGHFITTESLNVFFFPGTESTLWTTELCLRSHSLFPTVLILRISSLHQNWEKSTQAKLYVQRNRVWKSLSKSHSQLFVISEWDKIFKPKTTQLWCKLSIQVWSAAL